MVIKFKGNGVKGGPIVNLNAYPMRNLSGPRYTLHKSLGTSHVTIVTQVTLRSLRPRDSLVTVGIHHTGC